MKMSATLAGKVSGPASGRYRANFSRSFRCDFFEMAYFQVRILPGQLPSPVSAIWFDEESKNTANTGLFARPRVSEVPEMERNSKPGAKSLAVFPEIPFFQRRRAETGATMH